MYQQPPAWAVRDGEELEAEQQRRRLASEIARAVLQCWKVWTLLTAEVMSAATSIDRETLARLAAAGVVQRGETESDSGLRVLLAPVTAARRGDRWHECARRTSVGLRPVGRQAAAAVPVLCGSLEEVEVRLAE